MLDIFTLLKSFSNAYIIYHNETKSPIYHWAFRIKLISYFFFMKNNSAEPPNATRAAPNDIRTAVNTFTPPLAFKASSIALSTSHWALLPEIP